MGAWIETKLSNKQFKTYNVASYMGAWIETDTEAVEAVGAEASHPTWVRGLKHFINTNTIRRVKSHPTWVRGLKH